MLLIADLIGLCRAHKREHQARIDLGGVGWVVDRLA